MLQETNVSEDKLRLVMAELVGKAWQDAKNAAMFLVQKHNMLGHKGQLLFDQNLKYDFDKISLKVLYPPYDPEAMKILLGQLNDLVVKVQNFKWMGNFCIKCGEPIDQDSHCCRRCQMAIEKRDSRRDDHEYGTPSCLGHKKPGSAARRGNGHVVNNNIRPRDRKKGKGGKTAK